MDIFEVSAILLTATAIGGFVNQKWLKLPSSIGLMLIAIAVGGFGLLLQHLNWIDVSPVREFLKNIDFSEVVFHGMLPFLLFAGALQINLDDLKNARLPVAATATVSTFISTALIGLSFYYFSHWLGFNQITFLYAMLFGAILSPTDPIAVIGIIKKFDAPKSIETKIAGESLFNDGVAIVFFLTILNLIEGNGDVSASKVATLLLQEAGGGLMAGGIIGWVACQMLSRIDAYPVELLITIAVTTGGYLLAEKLHVSAPLAMVAAGIIIGNDGRTSAMSENTRQHIDAFWVMVDEVLNAVLFVLVGLEMMLINVSGDLALLGVACILLALTARFISLAIPIGLMKPLYAFAKGTSVIMTWGGLRGALSIAMVFALKDQPTKEIFLSCVYFVVIFSIVVQGLTFSRLLKKLEMV